MKTAEQWDVFISYAREDVLHAKDVQEALLRYVTADGAPPRIYLDVSQDGTPAGADWENFLKETLSRTRCVVALYSQRYFEKRICQWELHAAYLLHVRHAIPLLPVLIDPHADASVPFSYHSINWIPVTRPNWLEELREASGLQVAATRRILGFGAEVGEAVAGRALEPVRVAVSRPDGSPALSAEVSVTLAAQPAEAGLAGTLTVPAVGGTAVFHDLVLHTPTDAVRLVATAPGCEPAELAAFPVRAMEVPTPQGGAGRGVIEARGRPVFFPDGRALAVLDGDTLTVHLADGYEAAGSAKLTGPPRLWARGAGLLAVADWSGRVLLASPDGAIRAWDLPARGGGRPRSRFNVPGALAFDGDELYVGTWAGQVWSVPLGDAEPEPVLEHPAGVQVLTVDAGRFLVGGLDGTYRYWADGAVAAQGVLEPLLLASALVRDYGLIVGERQVHRLDPARGQLLQVSQPVTGITGALAGSELTAIVDAEGRFVCFDAELAVSVGFRTVPGARPVDSGAGGRLLVLEHPDGSHALVREGRADYVSGHPLAVTPDGERVALSDGSRLVVLAVGELTDGDGEPGPQDPR
jgi:TIR domain